MKSNILRVGLLSLFLAVAAACGTNIFKSAAETKSDRTKMAKARVLMDDGKYSEARDILEDLDGDTNEARVLLVAAMLGESGLSIWDILVEVVDRINNNASGSGIDNFFNLFDDSIYGTGTEREGRLAALSSGMELLKTAPDPAINTVNNLRCFLAGILALPTVTDGKAAIESVNQVLLDIQSTATGTGSTAQECPDVSRLADALTTVSRIRTDFSEILETAEGCSFIDISQASTDLNGIEQKLKTLTDTADKGCAPVPTCTAGPLCDALQMGCVQDVMNDNAVAGDGIISSCEMVQNCTNPISCFGG